MFEKTINKALFIGAHYDDVELGAGGTMAKMVAAGIEVFKLTLTDNDTSFKQKNIHVKQLEAELESAKACAILGATEVSHINSAKCTELNYNKALMQEVEAFIFDTEIDTVFTHFTHDVQQDHVGAATISYVAARYCSNVFMYQSNRYILPHDFYPRYFVDITNEIDTKRRALGCYTGSHNRFGKLFDATLDLNKVWGYTVRKDEKVRYAEGFHVIKAIS